MNDKIKMTGELMVEIREGYTRSGRKACGRGRLKSRDVIKNLVVTAGKTSLAAALRGSVSSNTGQITYCAVGTANTSPSVSDVKLTTELYRKQISIRTNAGAVASFQTFFNTAEANGTLKEAGLFGDLADGTTDSGTLYAHTLFTRTKTVTDTLTLTWSITVN